MIDWSKKVETIGGEPLHFIGRRLNGRILVEDTLGLMIHVSEMGCIWGSNDAFARNIPEKPWVPDDGRMWHEIEPDTFPPCNPSSQIKVLLASERTAHLTRVCVRTADKWYWHSWSPDDQVVAWAYYNKTQEVAK